MVHVTLTTPSRGYVVILLQSFQKYYWDFQNLKWAT